MVNAPTIPCYDCRQYDWAWDEKYQRWRCRNCTINGKPTPPPPEVDAVRDMDEWFAGIMEQYDEAHAILLESETKLKEAQDEKKSPIIPQARVNRAKKEKDILYRKVEMATLLKSFKEYGEKGDVYVEVPDADIKIRIKW